MKNLFFYTFLLSMILGYGCKSSKGTQTDKDKTGMNKTQKGTVVGAATGAVVGGMIGNKSKNTATGAILGAVVGGAVGAVIGDKMDKQAKKIEEQLGKDATVERIGEGIKVTFNSQLLFDYGKADLKEINKVDLQKLGESLKQNPGTDLLIVGHTDNVGSDSFNKSLSEKRAYSVMSYLNSAGIMSSRLRTQGMGESQPVADNTTDAGREQNRRVEIAIFANEKMKEDAKTQVGQ
jgi:outer membrane protein OmpA-like peptidoglycan-associated protein